MLIKETAWLIVIQSAIGHGSGQKGCIASVRSGRSEWLHASVFMWWEGNVTQIFALPSEEHAGIGWTRMAAGEL
jgi:hypothetical protein